MDFFLNELSLHGQFSTPTEFTTSLDAVMQIRASLKRLGADVFCRRDLANSRVTPTLTMPEIVNALPLDKRRAWLTWITQQGPFWPDDRRHSDGDWLELDNGELVTDSTVGEVAFRTLLGLPGDLVSLSPSNWLQSEISVHSRRGEADVETVRVTNHWTVQTAERKLDEARRANGRPYKSWTALAGYLQRKCERLRIVADAFLPLDGWAFHPGVAERFEVLLTCLDKLKGCFDSQGRRTSEGDRLYRDHFGHDKAWFTDSSDSEKNEFESELTFPHPDRPGEDLFCPWHGKVKIPPQYRVHFSWPCTKESPLYVVYVGPKITKR